VLATGCPVPPPGDGQLHTVATVPGDRGDVPGIIGRLVRRHGEKTDAAGQKRLLLHAAIIGAAPAG
jgi:hypothetical protein